MGKLLRITNTNEFTFYCPGCKCHHKINDTWRIDGADATLTVMPSILVTGSGKNGPLRCHLFIKNGMIEYLSDCNHDLKGQTISMIDEG